MSATGTQDFTDVIAARQEQGERSVGRDEAIKAIRTALKRRTGRTWSVRGDRGTAWGWITVNAPPKRRRGIFVEDGIDERTGMTAYKLVDSGETQEFGYMTPDDLQVLADALGLERVHEQGWTVPAQWDYRVEAIARAEGRTPSIYGMPDWD